MPRRTAFLVATLLSGLPGVAQTTRQADSLLAVGDTAAARSVIEAVLERDGGDAEAHYLLGMVHAARIEPDASVSADRRAAMEHLTLATRLDGDQARYWLGLAQVARTSADVTDRGRVGDFVGNARRAARQGTARDRADAAFFSGRLTWERYETRLHRRALRDAREIDERAFLTDWHYVEELFDRRFAPEDAGLLEWRIATVDLQAALAADPGHLDAAGLMVVALSIIGRADSGETVARAAVRSQPDSVRAWGMLGLALGLRREWVAADAAFDSAFARAGTLGFGPNDRPWHALDPFWLDDGNPPRAETFTRLLYADVRWGDPWRGYRGWETARGRVFVRYGAPDRVASTGAGGADRETLVLGTGEADPGLRRLDAAERLDRGRHRILWVYDESRRRYIFGIQQGFARGGFAGDAAGVFAQDTVREGPVFAPGPTVDSLRIHAFAFRGAHRDRADVVVFAAADGAVPAGATGGVLARAGGREIARQVGVLPDDLRWVVPLRSGPVTVRVEARTDATWRARGAVTAAVPSFSEPFALSDLVLTGPLPDAPAVRWTDVPLESPPRCVRPDGLGVLWETYGAPRYGVELRIVARVPQRRGLLAQVVGAVADLVGITSDGEEAVVLGYEREVPPGRDVGLEAFTVVFPEAPAGAYRVELTVTDRATARAVRREGTVTLC